MMLVKPLIFDREQRLGQIRRDVEERHVNALLFINRERELIFAVEDRRRLIHDADPADRVVIGKTLAEPGHEPDGTSDRQRDGKAERRHDAEEHARVIASSALPFLLKLCQTCAHRNPLSDANTATRDPSVALRLQYESAICCAGSPFYSAPHS